MCMSASAPAVEDGSVELFAAGSSPTIATAPPCIDVPAYTAWRSASVARSTPGALPYQMPTIPSYRQSGCAAAICDPITALAAYSSFIAGRQITGRSGASFAAAATVTS